MPNTPGAANPLRSTPLLLAAVAATAVLALIIAVDLASSELIMPTTVIGAGRMACAVLWVCWFVTWLVARIMRAIGPESAAYVAGFVDGVSRRTPTDRVDYSAR